MSLMGEDSWGDGTSDASFGAGPAPLRRGVKVAWQGGTKVDEENYLRMQEDYLRVMSQYNDSEKHRRQLVAKLARAEDAAKKLLAKGDKTVKGNVASRLFELEGELSRVQDENTQMRHKLARERKANEILRDRNKQLDLQARKALADYQRLLRQMKNPNSKAAAGRPTAKATSPGRRPGTAKSLREQAEEEEEQRRRFVEQQDELASLAEENKHLRDRLEAEGLDPDNTRANLLEQQLEDLRQQLSEMQSRALMGGGTVTGKIPAGTFPFMKQGQAAKPPGSPKKTAAGLPGSDWELHELEFDGHVYLLDPATKAVFSRPSDPNQWPHPVGRMVRPDPLEVEFRHQKQRGQDFYTQLDAYLRGDRKRLREVFAKFDSDGSDSLDRRELRALAEQLVPGIRESDLRYLVSMLDADGDGAVTYAELMGSVSDVVHAGQASKDTHSQEAMQVLDRLREVFSSRGQELEDLFRGADADGSGSLDFKELGRLMRNLLPSLSSHELRFLLAAVYKWDLDASGTISLPELKHSLHIGSWSNATGPLSPRRSPRRPGTTGAGGFEQLQSSIMGQQMQNDITRVHMENMELKQQVAILTQQAAEIGPLRRDLEDARLTAATAEDQWLMADPATLRRSAGGDVGAELSDAWHKVKELRQRWLDAKAALDSLRTDYTNVVNKLDEVHKQLNEERKGRFRTEKDKEFWRVESTKYRELEPELDKAQRRIVELEKENRQVFANIFNAPEDAMAELKRLKTELLEVRKAKAASEAREADARKELAQLRGFGETVRPGEVQQLRADNQRLERDLSKAKVDLDALMARMQIYDRTANAEITPDGTPRPTETGEAAPAGPVHGQAGADVYRQLQDLHNVWHEDKTELDKVRKLLGHEEERALALQAQLEETRAYYEDSMKDREKKLHDTGRLGHRQVERLEERIRKLEAQLRNAYSQGWKKGDGVRSSVVGGSIAVDLEDDLADLAADENIFEVHLASAALDEGVLGRNPPTFLSLDFFEHETQATAVVSSVTPEYDHTVQYVLKADTFFIEYLDTKTLVVELNRSKGWDFEAVGMARIPLQQCLDDFRLHAGVGRNRQYHYTDITGPGGRYLGRLRWAASVLKPIDKVLREYRMATEAKRAGDPRKSLAASHHPAALAIKQASEQPNTASHLRITIRGCRGLKPNVPPADSMPYVGYSFPGSDVTHYSPFGRGVNPTFNDEMVLPIVRTRELEDFLSRAELEFEVFDDADRTTGDTSIVGVATVALQELADGLPISGSVPLYSAQGRQRRGDVEVVLEWYNPLVVAQPPGGADRGAFLQRPGSGAPAVQIPRGSSLRVSRSRIDQKDESLRKMAGKSPASHPNDPEELQEVDGRSEASDLRLEAEDLEAEPSLSRQGAALGRDTRQPPYSQSPKPAAAPGHRGTMEARRSLSTRVAALGSPRPPRHGPRQSTFGVDSSKNLSSDAGSTMGRRYSQVDESLEGAKEMLPLVRDLSNRVHDDWNDLADNHIIIHVESVRLSNEVLHDPRVTSVFVMYEFLVNYVEAEEQVTYSHPKTSNQMDFNFCTAIRCGHTPELHRQARYAIGEIMRSDRDAYIPFCLVSDKTAEDEEYHEFGFCEINLHDILANGDLIHEVVSVVGPNQDETVATLTLTVIAKRALQNILEDTSP